MCIIMCGVKTTIKKVGFSQASIALTIGDLVIFAIEGKWLEVVVGMLEVSLFSDVQNKFRF